MNGVAPGTPSRGHLAPLSLLWQNMNTTSRSPSLPDEVETQQFEPWSRIATFAP